MLQESVVSVKFLSGGNGKGMTSAPGALNRRMRYMSGPAERLLQPIGNSKKAGWLANVDAAFRRLEFRNERRRNSQQAERACMRAWLQGRNAN